MSERLEALRTMVAEDPSDLLARFLLGRECLVAGELDEAIGHLSYYVERFDGDRGSAYGDLATALERRGRPFDAAQALRLGIANAEAHRHLQLTENLQEELRRLDAR